jgi:hypothetical protein
VEGMTLGAEAMPPVRFDLKRSAIVITPSLDNSRKKVRLQGNVPLAAPATVTLKKNVLKIKPENNKVANSKTDLTAKVIDIAINDLTLALDEKLAEASTYNLSLENGLTDGTGQTLKAKGKIKIPGLPTPPDAPSIDVRLSSAAAVNQKPFFDFAGNFAPPQPLLVWTLGGHQYYWDPKISIDVGLGQTKSNNSIILNLPFKTDIDGQRLVFVDKNSIAAVDVQDGEVAKIPTYLGWKRTPWYSLGSTTFRFGPKFEVDRRFARINTLATLRFDFNFHRWQATIKDKRNLLSADLREQADQVLMKAGFRIIPFVAVDLGRHATQELVENTKQKARLIVPRHNIARGYVGLNGLFQWQPFFLSLEENLIYLATDETIGFVTSAGVDQRKLRGIHHRGKASFDVSLDPAKRYSFNITYENGRLAPNFEYLNKVSVGIRLMY